MMSLEWINSHSEIIFLLSSDKVHFFKSLYNIQLHKSLNLPNRASDKKIKLEIALKEATEFHDALQAFVDWLTGAEKTLTNAKPVSRVMETLLSKYLLK